MNDTAATPTIVRFAGRYELLKALGHGAMGDVFLARDLATGSECALKRLRARPGVDFAEIRKEFELLSRIRHPTVVSVLNFGVAPDGTPFYTMEYVRGLPADRAVQGGDWPALFRITIDAAHALEALHAADVVHGDVKPGNLLVTLGADGVPTGVRLLDFGLATVLGRDAKGHRGTAGYAAPEVVSGLAPGRAADLYGLGATLYRLVTGRGAFGEDSVASVLRRQMQSPASALPLESAGAPQGLVRLVLRLMAAEPRERPADAHEVRSDLESLFPGARRPLEERLRRSVVVARERELARLERRIVRPRGRTRIMILAGPSGVGKSALLDELTLRMSLSERPVVQVHGGSLSGPSDGVRAMVVALAAEAGESLDRIKGLSDEASKVLTAKNNVATERDIAPLVVAAVGLIRRIEQRGAPVLIIDDADRLDPQSRWFLRRVSLHPNAARTVSIWAQASVDADSANDVAVLVDAGLAETIAIGPLDADGIGRLVAARFREPARDSLVDFLWTRAKGHPGFTVELLLHAVEQRAIRESAAGLIADPEQLEKLGLPESFEASLTARVRELPDAARRAACALAVAGRAVTIDELRALEASIDDPAVQALTAAGFARAGSHGELALISPAFAERLLETLEEGERRDWYTRALELPGRSAEDRFRMLCGTDDAAAALEAAAQAFEHNPSIAVAECAAELAEAESPDRAATWHDRAASTLRDRGRYKAMVPHLERALELEGVGEAAVERLAGLANALFRSGDLDAIPELVDRGLKVCSRPVQRARLLNAKAARLHALGRADQAIAVSDEALLAAEQSGDQRVIAITNLGRTLMLRDLGRLEEALQTSQRAEEVAGKSADMRLVARARCSRGAVSLAQLRTAEAEEFYAQALKTARRQDARLVIEEALHGLTAVRSELGKWQAMRDTNREAARIAMEDNRQIGVTLAITNLATAECLTGRPRPAHHWSASAFRLARKHAPWLEASAWRARSMALLLTGNHERAIAAAEEAIAAAQRLSRGFELEWSRVEYGRALIAANRWSQAGNVFEQGVAAKADLGSIGSTIHMALSGRAAIRRNDLSVARSRLEACEAWLKAHPAPYAEAFVAQLRAEIAICDGSAHAVDGVTATLEKFMALPAMGARSEAAMAFGELAIETGSASIVNAISWLEAAAASFDQLGNRRGRERALSLLVEALRRSRTAPTHQMSERDLLARVSHLLNSLSDLNQLSRRAMELVVEQLNAERGVLLMMDEDTKRLEPVFDYGAMDPESQRDAVSFSRRVVREVIDSGASLLIGDAASQPGALSESMMNLRLCSIVCVPMFLGGRVIGAVYLDDSRRADVFNERDRSLLEGFAQLMAVAIDKSRAHEEVQQTNEALMGEAISLRQKATHQFQPHQLIGTSRAMQRVLSVVERTAKATSTVLLTGENGTGKELIARTLHSSGKRRLRPFISVNCGAIPETLLETELFGILPNVATDVRGRPGKFQLADSGTLFLDEVGDMPLSQQVALLSALASREITPVGGNKPIPVDVRLIAATNGDLRGMIERGEFREDLFYRLNVIPIEVPPLRDRKADIPALAQYFAAQFASEQDREVPELSAEFLAAIMQSDWPGNVRELRNYIERVMAMNPGNVLYPTPLPRDLEERAETVQVGGGQRLPDMVEELERRLIQEALSRSGGNQSLAARELGVPEQAIRYRMKKYGIVKTRENRRSRSKWR